MVNLIFNPDENDEGEDGAELAPNHIWQAFAIWTLDRAKQYPTLASLAEQVPTPNAAAAVAELTSILATPKLPAKVKELAISLKEIIEDLGESDTLLID